MSSAQFVALFALLAGSAFAGSAEESANPIRKIVTLMQDMAKEIEAEGAKEQELYDKFMCFCQGGEAELQKTISDAGATVETLSSQEKEDSAVKTGLEGDLVKHKADREAATGDLDKATAIRGKEQSEYEQDLADQQSSFDAISGAIPALEQGMGGASLLQSPGVGKRLKHAVEASQVVSSMEKKDVMAFLENKGDYAPQSGQIVGILKNMKDEMEKSIAEIKASEQSAVQGFADLKGSKEKEIELASEAIESKTKRAGELAVSVVQAQDGAEDAAKEKADAEKFLSTLGEQCKNKEAEHAERSKVRTEEVAAIGEAINILNDDDALDVFKKAVPSMLLEQSSSTKPTSARKFGFLQSAAASPDALRRAEGIIDTMTQFHRSQRLDLLAFTMKTQMRSVKKAQAHGGAKGAVDFSAITKMIDEMVGVLTAEEADDSKHKVWCQGEFASSADEEASANEKASSTAAQITEVTDELATVTEDIATLQAGVAALDKDVSVATEQRKEEHAEYLETVSLTETAIQLIGKAKNRLQKFYNPALYKAPPKKELSEEDAIVSKLGGFVQVHAHRLVQPEAPETASGPYQPKSQKSGGVMALMDMIVKELETSLSDAQHDEKTAQKDYTELMSDSQATRATDLKSITEKTATQADMQQKITDLKASKALTMEELENVGKYISELHGSCDFIMENFKLRSEARTSEIEGLKNAKAVLAGASYN